MSGGKPWLGWTDATPEQRTAAVETALRAGMSRSQVAAHLRTTKSAICGWIVRHVIVTPDMVHRRPPKQIKAGDELAETAKRIRELVAADHGVRGAARLLNISRNRAYEIAKIFNIRATAEQINKMRRNNARKGAMSPARKKPAKVDPRAEAAPRRLRNPNLTPAQQANVDAMKQATWVQVDRRLLALPRVTDDEAARLVAEFAARRGITKCPPPVEMQTPCNWGEGWGLRKPR